MEDEVLLLGDWVSWTPDHLLPSAWGPYVPLAAWITETLQPKVSVEVGSGAGESFRALCQIVDRFSRSGRLLGIDSWKCDARRTWQGDSQYESLRDYCATRHSGTATLSRMDITAAASEFDNASIDFLHIARTESRNEDSALDLGTWLPKLSDGAVILITGCDSQDEGDQARKLWRQLSEMFPSTVVGLPSPAGLVQIPRDGDAPLVEFLTAGGAAISALFRSLGERVEYRHAIGSEPVSPSGLRRYMSGMMADHAEGLRRAEAQHRAALEAMASELDSASERLQARAGEVQELKSQTDVLLARMASQAAAQLREIAEVKRACSEDLVNAESRFTTALEELSHKYVAEASVLHSEIARREVHIQALTRTLSWRITKPLRIIQAIRIRFSRRAT